MEENRVEAGVREWRGHMKRLSDLFDESITQHPNIKKTQLAHFREVIKRPLPNITKDEKMMLGVLKGEIRRMERALYPSRLVRLFRSLSRLLPANNEQKPMAAAQLTIKQKPETRPAVVAAKREVAPVRSLEKKKAVNHNLLPKKRNQHSNGIKR